MLTYSILCSLLCTSSKLWYNDPVDGLVYIDVTITDRHELLYSMLVQR
jgi:hypothetical protein